MGILLLLFVLFAAPFVMYFGKDPTEWCEIKFLNKMEVYFETKTR